MGMRLSIVYENEDGQTTVFAEFSAEDVKKKLIEETANGCPVGTAFERVCDQLRRVVSHR